AALYADSTNEALFRAPLDAILIGWWLLLQSELHYREAKILIEGEPPPEDAQLWFVRGRALAALGRDEQAVASFSKAIDLKPMFAPAWFSRADAHERLGQWGKAIADHAQGLKLAPEDPAARNKFAWLLATCPAPRFRDARRAVELAQKAVALAPRDANMHNTLGAAHYRAGEWPAAVAALLEAVELRHGTGRIDSSDLFFLAMA